MNEPLTPDHLPLVGHQGPHPPDSFAALADDAARDAAMARALGWRECIVCIGADLVTPTGTVPNTTPGWQDASGQKYATCDARVPPPYFRGGDSDAFANWALLAEVWRLLRSAPDATWQMEDMEQQGWLVVANPVSRGDLPPNYAGSWGNASTPHRAACLAAVAAGLVPREEA